jgi:hypothetical protein
MADALGLASSILSIAQLTHKVLEVVKDARNAPKEITQFVDETNALRGLLMSLEDRVNSAQGVTSTENWSKSLLKLCPIFTLLRDDLKDLDFTLNPKGTSDLKALGKRLTWNHDKKGAVTLFGTIERLKSLVLIALREDDL